MCFINFCLAVWRKYNIDVLEDDFFFHAISLTVNNLKMYDYALAFVV